MIEIKVVRNVILNEVDRVFWSLWKLSEMVFWTINISVIKFLICTVFLPGASKVDQTPKFDDFLNLIKVFPKTPYSNNNNDKIYWEAHYKLILTYKYTGGYKEYINRVIYQVHR